MLKRVLAIAAVAIFVPLAVVLLDAALGPRSPFGGNLEVKLSHLIMGGPQSKAVDVTFALDLFDDTCMTGTVFKLPPYAVGGHFLAAGLHEDDDGSFSLPTRPLRAFAFDRPEGAGFECSVRFVSFEDVDEIIRPAFDAFTATRLTKPMIDNPKAFRFTNPPVPEGVQSDRPAKPDPAIIRSFADADDIQYFVILRPDSYSLNHIIQLIVLPIAEIEG